LSIYKYVDLEEYHKWDLVIFWKLDIPTNNLAFIRHFPLLEVSIGWHHFGIR